jgi:Hint domain
MAVLTVGPGAQFTTISDAVAAANTGDTIDVQAGTYTNDFPQLINKSITLQGVGGMVNLVATQDIPNQKGILDVGGSGVTVTIDNFAISGGIVSDGAGGNGAAIRYEGGNLTLNNDYIFDNQEGLLGASDPSGSITINSTEFADNGNNTPGSPGYGFTHNLYVGDVATLTIDNSYFTGANVGHEIKSRALETIIENSRIQDGPTGTASYGIDLPNGGIALIENNVIEKGPDAQNPGIISYGEEGNVYAGSSLTVTGNTILNDNGNPAVTAVVNDTNVTAEITGNSFFNLTSGQIMHGPASVSGSVFLATEPVLDTAPPLCFVAGTRIATPRGEVAVERLEVGDVVLTHVGAQFPIVWIGVNRVLVAAGRRGAATPVIVRRGALADNVPDRDLYVTKGHSFYLDDVLIPVEFLVNHRSILWDDRPQEVEIYHVELSSHAVLLANGAPAESYRDDGNRRLFRNGNSGWDAPPKKSYAPVLTGGPVVDAVWRRLSDRAGNRLAVSLTDEPDLHLLCDGRRVNGCRRSDDVHVFRLSSVPDQLRVVSRAGVPAELGFARDPRTLGVALRRILVWQGAQVRLLDASDPSLDDGCHAFEEDNGFRWTNGNARLPAALFGGIDGPIELDLHVGGATRYPAQVGATAGLTA